MSIERHAQLRPQSPGRRAGARTRCATHVAVMAFSALTSIGARCRAPAPAHVTGSAGADRDGSAPPRPGPARPGRRAGGARARAAGRGPRRRHPRPRRSRRGGPRRAARRPASIGLDRDPHALELAGERLAPYGDRTTFVHAVYDEIPDVLDDLGLDAVDGVLFDLGVSSMQLDDASAVSPTPRTPRWTCGWTHAPGTDRRRRAQHLLGAGPGPDPARVRRGAVRPPDRRSHRARARDGAVHHRPARLVELMYAAIPAPARRTGGHPPSAPSRRCGSRSTTSWRCCAGRSRPRSTRSPSAAGWWWCPTTRWRTGSPSSAFTAATRTDVPPDLPVVPEGHEPDSPGHPRRREGRPSEIAENPRAARSGCGPPNGSDERSSGMSTSASPSGRIARAADRARPPSSGPASPSSRGAGPAPPRSRS